MSIFEICAIAQADSLTLQPFDYLPSPKADDPFNPVHCLLGAEGIKKYLTHPYVSPLFGDMTGLPPLLIQAGDAEVLRDEITLLAHKASLAGVSVEHEIFEDCVHVFQAFLFLEASRKALQSQRHFIKYRLPQLNKPKNMDFGEIDADIAADAHQVDESGNAEPTSLPSSPRAGPTVELPPEQDSDSDLQSDGTTPRDSPQDSPTITDSQESRTVADAPHRTPRPILRAYASARDLGMSPRNAIEPLRSPPADSSTSDPTDAAAHAATAALVAKARKHRHHSSAAITLTSRAEQAPRPLHAKSSSHPDLRALIEDYTTRGPSHQTRVYGPTASGHATPPDVEDDRRRESRPESIKVNAEGPAAKDTSMADPGKAATEVEDAEEVIEVLGKRKTTRGRAPSASLAKAPSSPRA